MSEDKRQLNRLDDAERFKLYDELKSAQPEIDKDKLSPTQLAERLTKRLGFTVTKGNVKGIGVKTLGLKFHDSPGIRPFNVLLKRVEAAEVRISQLEMCVSDLRMQLGLAKAIKG